MATEAQLKKIATDLYQAGLSGYPLNSPQAAYDIERAVSKLTGLLK